MAHASSSQAQLDRLIGILNNPKTTELKRLRAMGDVTSILVSGDISKTNMSGLISLLNSRHLELKNAVLIELVKLVKKNPELQKGALEFAIPRVAHGLDQPVCQESTLALLGAMVENNNELDLSSVAPKLHSYLCAKGVTANFFQLKTIQILSRTNNAAMLAVAMDRAVIKNMAAWLSPADAAISGVVLTALRKIFPSHEVIKEAVDTRVLISPLVALLQEKHDLLFSMAADLLLVLVFDHLDNKRQIQNVVPPLLIAKLTKPDNPELLTHVAALKLLFGIFCNNPDMASRLAIEESVRAHIFPFIDDGAHPDRQQRAYEFTQVFMSAAPRHETKATALLVSDIAHCIKVNDVISLRLALRTLFLSRHQKEPGFKMTVSPFNSRISCFITA